MIKFLENNTVNEGNPVSSKLPGAIDSFLQDIAQIHGTIDYGNIMDHDYTDEDIKKLRSLRRKWREEAQYEEDPDAQKACQDVAEKVAEILKGAKESVVTEDTNADYVVKRVVMDVAAKDEDHAKKIVFCGGAGNMTMYHAIADALESCGYELAGDMIDITDDHTEAYRDNDFYDFYGIKDYVVRLVEMDVAARDEEHAKGLNSGGGAGDQRVFKALDDALESCGYEMAGDQTMVTDDFTDVYKTNDYEFFTESAITEDDDEEYPYSSLAGKKFRKSNQSGLEGEVEITIPSFTIKYTVADGIQFKDPSGIDSNDDAELHLADGEQDRIDKLIKSAVIAEMKKKGFSAYSGHSALVGIPATVKFSKGVTESEVVRSYNPTMEYGVTQLSADIAYHPGRYEYLSSDEFEKDFDEFLRKEGMTVVGMELSDTESLTNDYKNAYGEINLPKISESFKVGDKVAETGNKDKFVKDFIPGKWKVTKVDGNKVYADPDDDEAKEYAKKNPIDKNDAFFDTDTSELSVVKESDDYEPIAVELDTTVEVDTFEQAEYIKSLEFREAFEEFIATKVDGQVTEISVSYDNLDESSTEDYDMANPKDAEDIDLKLKATLSVKTYEAVEALQRPRFRMKLRELVGGFGAELHNCSVDETNPIDMED